MLTWHAIEWAKNAGFTAYDFSGVELDVKHNDANNPAENTLLNYKKKWGGMEIPHYQFIKIRKNNSYKLLNALIYPTLISRKLRRKLYLSLNRFARKT